MVSLMSISALMISVGNSKIKLKQLKTDIKCIGFFNMGCL